MNSETHTNQTCLNCRLSMNIFDAPYGICSECANLSFIEGIVPLKPKDYLTLTEKLLFLSLILFLGVVIILFLLTPVGIPWTLDRLS